MRCPQNSSRAEVVQVGLAVPVDSAAGPETVLRAALVLAMVPAAALGDQAVPVDSVPRPNL